MHKPGDNLLLYDGLKATPLSEMRDWGELYGTSSTTTVLAPLDAYEQVPWLFRAVDLRAKALAKLPIALYRGRSTTDLSESTEYAPLVRRIRALLFLTEASLTLHGKNYWALEANQFGLNLTPRWVVPTNMQPEWQRGQLTHFTRTIDGQQLTLPLDRVLYIWTPNLRADVGPGLAPAAVACASAGVLHHLDTYLAHYFERGAIRATLLQIDGNPPKAEKEKLEAWWKRMLGGVKKAYETVAISATVKPIVIGDSLKETVNKDLTEQERQNIATALGIPHSWLASNVLAGGTADAETLNFYDGTIIPECELIEGPLNEQYLSRLGLRLEFQPKRLECYQAAELKKAEAVSKLLPGQAILTVDEARELLGYGPMPTTQVTGDRQQATGEGQPTSDSKSPEATQAVPDTAKQIDLDKWERKALKKIGQAVSFDSPHIPIEDQQTISRQLATCATPDAVKHLFAAYKKVEELSEAEQALYDAVEPVFARHGGDALQQILNGKTVSLALLDADLKAALLPILVEHVLQEATALAEAIGPDFDPAAMATAASEWAETYTFELVKGVTANTQAVLQKAISSFTATPGMTRAQLETLLRPAFGAKRAESIAITEITRAASEANRQYQRYLADNGIEMETVWDTNADDRVCAVCGPLHKTVTDQIPPAHPRCRCKILLRRPRG